MIQNVGLFTKILKTTDKVVTKFLEDSKVEEKIDEANTAHNFFSNQVYGKSMLEVIDSKIRQEQEEIDYIKKTISGIYSNNPQEWQTSSQETSCRRFTMTRHSTGNL